MRRLRQRGADDSGAIAVLVAILLSSGLLLGMSALVIDVGLLADEREQLQSGADSAAWGVAQACISEPADCAAQGQLAASLANANSRDERAGVTLDVCTDLCDLRPRDRISPCQDLAPGFAASYAEVRTSTETADGATVLPPRVAQGLIGGQNTGTQVNACSQVAWGLPGTLQVFGLGISVCDVQNADLYGVPGISPATRQHSGIVPGDLDPPAQGDDQTFVPLDLVSPVTCASAGLNLPQGFAWLGNTQNCSVTVARGDAAPIVGAPTAACRNALATIRNEHEPVLVPVYRGNPTLTSVRVVGFAVLVVTGHRGLIVPADQTSWLGGTTPTVLECLLQVCFSGYFSKMLVPRAQPEFVTGADYGVTVMGRIG